ncbi:unnamed protein product [Fusarium equiseti]|uniref:FAD dependent oxidoreductase domain-containing protein n=1 Tax=Fusarium equiseti TaxID=61235 RepID=A0A8J2J3C3_FUSEQ|nr:unnamed protein product [Fusarium equiseti]
MSFTIPAAPLPVQNPTEPYWLSQPHEGLSNYRVSDTVPSHVDTVIIGSGISGALIAHGLLMRPHVAKNTSVLMLEARAVASGASGRNGGHIKPDCYKNFAAFEDQHGTEIAKALCSFELECMHETVRFIHENNLVEVTDLVLTRSTDIFMTETSWEDAKVSIERYRAAGGDVSHIHAYDAAEAKKGVYGAVSYPACSLWPYKAAVSIIEKCVSHGLQLFTNTPALSIEPSEAQGRWLIKTSRGKVTCNNVFHATNGYVSNLVPDLAGKVVPCKGNVIAVRPNSTWFSNPLEHTAGIQWGRDFDYMIQRPNDGKPLVFGGRDLAHPRDLLGPIGDADDSTITAEIIDSLVRFPKTYMRGWTSEKSDVSHAWSGIMGFTADEFPFVGQLPGRPGQFLSVGYTGHGMARVFLCIKALLEIVRNEPIDPRVPEPYLKVKERLQKPETAWEAMLAKAYVTKDPSKF